MKEMAMPYLEDQLDALAIEEAAAIAHVAPCGCARCRRPHSFDEAARRRPRPGRSQTSARARGSQLPGWWGWTPAVSLRQIDQARAAAGRGQSIPAALRPFLAPGPQIYRISRAGIDRDRPLNIGMTKGTNSIAQRIVEHFRQPSRADPRVYSAIHNLQPGQVLVQAARLTRQGMHPRRARTYEGWLQDRERPLLYDRNSTTFDEAAIRFY
jgi:hypothetical protein